MKRAQLIPLFTLAAFLAAGITGCKNPDKGITNIPGHVPKVAGPGPGPALGAGATTTGDPSTTLLNPDGTSNLADRRGFDGWEPDRAMFASETVYFDFDRKAVKPSEKGKVENVANYFKGNRVNKLRIEGHCDERGTEEYNRSLGESRANALREYIIRLGVDADRIQTLSMGEDKPAAKGHNEAAWSKNRRGEFILLTPPKP